MEAVNTYTDKTKPSGMRLYDQECRRLYINGSERLRFIEAAHLHPDHIRIFCLTLLYTGCRLSEARELSAHAIQVDEQIIAVRSLKKRNQNHIREIPVPLPLVQSLETWSLGDLNVHVSQNQNNTFLWASDKGMVDRITAYRWVKSVMHQANIFGPQASPKGLRHGFGIHAVLSQVPLNMLQKWMGHASIQTTAIYANAVGREEMLLAEKMWT